MATFVPMNATSWKHRRVSPETLPATVQISTRRTRRGYIASIRTIGQAWRSSRDSEADAVRAVCDEYALAITAENGGDHYVAKGWSATRVADGHWLAWLRRGLELRKGGGS